MGVYCDIIHNSMFDLTLRPWKRERSLRGPRALRVIRKWMFPSVENPNLLAVRDTKNTWKTHHTC